MAINPLIPMQGQPVDLGQAAALGVNAYQGAQRNALLQQNQELQKPLIEAQTQAAQQALTKEQALFQLGDAAADAIQVKPLLASDPQRAIAAMDARIEKVRARNGDPSHTMALREGLASGQLQPQQVMAELDAVIDAASQSGVLGSGLDASTRGFRAMTSGMSADDIEKARRIELGLEPRAMGSAGITIAQQGLTIPVAQSQAVIKAAESGASRQAESSVDLDMKPQIESATTAAKTTAEESAKRGAGIIKAIGEEKEVSRILDLAEPLLKDATQSLAGSTIDSAGRLVGLSSKGAEAAAQLKTLEGALIMKMPRMEGPQSNADQLLYRQMAAQIGDATVPAPQRKAAMDMLRSLNKRYSGGQQPQANSAQTAKRLRYNPQTGQLE